MFNFTSAIDINAIEQSFQQNFSSAVDEIGKEEGLTEDQIKEQKEAIEEIGKILISSTKNSISLIVELINYEVDKSINFINNQFNSVKVDLALKNNLAESGNVLAENWNNANKEIEKVNHIIDDAKLLKVFKRIGGLASKIIDMYMVASYIQKGDYKSAAYQIAGMVVGAAAMGAVSIALGSIGVATLPVTLAAIATGIVVDLIWDYAIPQDIKDKISEFLLDATDQAKQVFYFISENHPIIKAAYIGANWIQGVWDKLTGVEAKIEDNVIELKNIPNDDIKEKWYEAAIDVGTINYIT